MDFDDGGDQGLVRATQIESRGIGQGILLAD
jgi:hypothetical protein